MDILNISAYVGNTSVTTLSLCTFIPAKSPLKPQLRPRNRRLHTPCPFIKLFSASANQRKEALNEDDNVLKGGGGHKFGMAMPNLTDTERGYLEAATSNRDYMRRMTDLVRQKDQERRAAMSKKSAQGPEDYLKSLARPTTPPADAAPPRVNAGDAYMEALARKSRYDRGIENPPVLENHRSSTAPAGPAMQTDKEEADEFENLEERISRLQESLARVKGDIDPNSTIEDAIAVQEAIRRDIGLDPPYEPEPKMTTELISEAEPESTPQPQAIEKQIDFLENYLERLRQEEAEENVVEEDSDADVPNKEQMKEEVESQISQLADKFTPQIEGLKDTPGGMSAAEKMAAFERLREQAMKASAPDPRFEDPYNTVLPSKKTADYDGEEPSPDSEAEYEDIGSHMYNKNLLIEEIEVEVARYITNAKALLQKHDARMQVLLARLRALQ